MKKPAQQCHYTREKRYKGLRYVHWRGRCKKLTHHPSGYCHLHRLP